MATPFRTGFIFVLTLYLILNLLASSIYARSNTDSPSTGRKQIKALRTDSPPKIDGWINETVWSGAETASGFYQYEPFNDRPASFSTTVRILYDNHNIYIGACLTDPHPGLILKEMGLRDENNLNADTFTVELNPFDDGLYGYSFRVSSSGVQSDANMAVKNGWRDGDYTWDAVWMSSSRITEDGWMVEIRIPYSALRFPKQDVQSWGVNFWREIRRKRETSSWNYVDRQLGNRLGSLGVLKGISRINPHLRLSFYPYISGYLENNSTNSNWAGTLNGGMDIKYGLSESFTLDTTLIPDFGQVQSDALELNLTPYEIKYDEKRQFFTESMELFNKADLFYSRRIGGIPYGYEGLNEKMAENETVISNPRETRLINASKLSGRTSGGLGIGLFNAITARTRARILNISDMTEREITTQPLSNYTLLVLDQTLPNNSFVSFVNASALGLASGYTSNVTGTEFSIRDRTQNYKIAGTAAVSQRYYSDAKDIFGTKYSLDLGRVGGTWQYSYSRDYVSADYHQNDLGYLRRNNEFSDTFSLSHNIFSPFWVLNNLTNQITFSRSAMSDSGEFSSFSIGYHTRMLFRDRFMLAGDIQFYPKGERDFYESRVPGRFLETHRKFTASVTFSSNYGKPVYIDGNATFSKMNQLDRQNSFYASLTPTFRISNRCRLSGGFGWGVTKNEIGYVSHSDSDNIYFGQRNTRTLVPVVSGSFMFNRNLSLSIYIRHYWSRVTYTGDYFLLGSNGELEKTEQGVADASNINYNSFTMDTQLTWNFAPGSQLSLVWKNAIYNYHDRVFSDYFDNARFFLGQPQVNSISIKILYYLDYQKLSRK